MSLKKYSHVLFLLVLTFLISGCETNLAIAESDAENTMSIWVSPDYRSDSVYLKVPINP